MKEVHYRVKRFSVDPEHQDNKNIKIDTGEMSKFKNAMNRLTGGDDLVD